VVARIVVSTLLSPSETQSAHFLFCEGDKFPHY